MAIITTEQVRTVQTSRGDVRVLDTGGTGPVVLLVHSLLVDPDLYAAVVPDLIARGYRCVVPELPLGAHGVPLDRGADLSPPGLAALIAEVLDAVGVDRAHVVGVDTGGALTQLLMAGHRDRVDSVVLTACDAYEAFPPRSIRALSWPLRSSTALGVLAQAARPRFVRRWLTARPVTHRGVDDTTLVRWTTPLQSAGVRADLRAVARSMHPRHTLAAAEANRDFPRPVLIAWGEDDRIFPRRLAERLEADLPHARLVTLPDCAALAPLDQPGLLAAMIDDHVRSTSAESAYPAGR